MRFFSFLAEVVKKRLGSCHFRRFRERPSQSLGVLLWIEEMASCRSTRRLKCGAGDFSYLRSSGDEIVSWAMSHDECEYLVI